LQSGAETVTADIASAECKETAAVTPEQETVDRQPGIVLALVVALAALGVAVVAGVAVFLIQRKK
jgi:hypothetical protein